MNVQELRDALHQQAARVEDIGAASRVAETHERVVVVRRHRRAGVAAVVAAAAVAVVTAGTLVLLPGQEPVQPAQNPPPATLAGHRVDRTYSVGGWRFVYSRGVTSTAGQDTVTVRVPASDRPHVLGWGVGDQGDGEAVLRVDGAAVERGVAGSWTTGDVLAAGSPHRVTVQLRRHNPASRAGIAVYDVAGPPPDGVGNGTSVFRRAVAGNHLLGAALGKPGQAELSFDVPATGGRVAFSLTCSGASERTKVGLAVDGSPVSSTGCTPLPDLDPGTSYASPDHLGARSPATLHVTVRVPGQAPPGVVIGGAAYALAPAVVHVAGWPVPELSEGPGGDYRYRSHVESRPGARRLVLRLPASDSRRIVQTASSHLVGDVRVTVDGRAGSSFSGGGFGGGEVLSPGRPHTVVVTVLNGLRPRTLLGLVVSTKVP